MGAGQLSQVMAQVSKSVTPYAVVYATLLTYNHRDPSQHAQLKARIEEQSTALYSSARLWDDGIIRPTDTRDVVGLALALSARKKFAQEGGSSSTTWDGSGRGFGVFRM